MTKIILNEKPPESHIDGQASYEKVSRKVRIHVQQLVVGDFEILRRRELCYSTSDLIHLLPLRLSSKVLDASIVTIRHRYLGSPSSSGGHAQTEMCIGPTAHTRGPTPPWLTS